MKLPVGKKERIILFSGIGVVTLGILFAVVQWGVLPLFESRHDLEASLDQQRMKLKKARRELDYFPGLQKNYYDIIGRLARIRSESIQRPILGSYLVGVSEQVDQCARLAGVKVDDVREIGVGEMPHRQKPATPSSFKIFSVLVYAQGSYETLSHFLQRIEETHPFMCVSEIGIVGQADNPEVQRLTARMEWPIEPSTEVAKGATP